MNSICVIVKLRKECEKGIVKDIRSALEYMPEYNGVDVNDVESVKSVRCIRIVNVNIGVNGNIKTIMMECEFHLKEKKGRNVYKGLYQYDVILDKVNLLI